MAEFVTTPSKDGRSTLKGSPGDYNGEPGMQKRTMGPNSLPEKTYENAMPGSDGKKEGGNTFLSTPSKVPGYK